MPLLLPRKRSELPRELTERRGNVDMLITIASDAFENGTFGAAKTVDATRQQLHHLCPDYKPSRNHVGDVLCASGEIDGEPKRSVCHRCVAGQFSPSGLFCGELIPVSTLLKYEPA